MHTRVIKMKKKNLKYTDCLQLKQHNNKREKQKPLSYKNCLYTYICNRHTCTQSHSKKKIKRKTKKYTQVGICVCAWKASNKKIQRDFRIYKK